MANRGLGTLTLDLILKMGGFERGMDKAARVADKRMREIERRAQQFGKFLGVAIATGATAATAAIVALTKNAIDSADAMRDLSIRIGVSTETLSAYGYAATQTGTDIDALGRGLKILAKNAADAINPTSEQAKVFEALGIEVTDAEGELRSLSMLVPEIADKFKGMADGTTKAALAQALFGKSGLELTEFLNSGAAGLDEFTEKAARLGIVIDSQTAAAADAFNDSLGDLKMQAHGLGLSVAKDLLPHLQSTSDELGALVKQGDLAANIAAVMGAAFNGLTAILSGYTKAVSYTTLAMVNYSTVAQSVLEIQRNLMTFGFANGSVSGALDRIRQQKAASDAEWQMIKNPKSNPFANVRGLASTVSASGGGVDEAAVSRALSNPTGVNARTAAIRNQGAAVQEVLSLEEQWAILEAGVYTPAAIEAHNRRVEAWARETRVVEESTSAMSVYAERAGSNIQDALADFLFDPFDKGLSGMVDAFADTLRQMYAELLSSKILEYFGLIGGGMMGGQSAGTLMDLYSGSGFGFAKGGVPAADLSRYSGTIVSEPTFFASGGNVMGEAGPEGIFPLKRGPDGKLGVVAMGGGSTNVEVRVINNSGAPARTEESTGLDGRKLIEVFIGEVDRRILGNGSTGKAVGQRFGLQPVGVSRG